MSKFVEALHSANCMIFCQQKSPASSTICTPPISHLPFTHRQYHIAETKPDIFITSYIIWIYDTIYYMNILYELIDTRFLDSNRRVGVWSLPWRWHILSIPLTTGRGTSAETCRLDDVFPPDDLGSRPEALCWYVYIYICIPYMSSVIGRIYIYIYIYIYI